MILGSKSVILSKVKEHPRYKVILINDKINRVSYVSRILIRVIEDMLYYEAKEKTNEAHETGSSILRVCDQYKSELICEGLRNNGLISIIESV